MVTITGAGKLAAIRVFKKFSSVITAARDAALTLADIPIGLPEAGMVKRACDVEARKFVGVRRSSVFPVPARQAVQAKTYEEANSINFKELGRRLNLQSWGLSARIREVDFLLSKQPSLQKRIRETHPEVCFCGLNGARPLSYSKKSSEGQKERLDIILKYIRLPFDPGEKARQSRGKFATDDLLDAVACAITAWKCCEDKLYTFPEEEPAAGGDEPGLRMEIVYWRPSE
jgi:predicted RNase H-like nuclease